MSNGGNGTIGLVERATRVIRDVGFPIAVAAFLLYSLPPRLKGIVDAINDNSRAVDRQTHRCQQLSEKINVGLRMAEENNRLLHRHLNDAH